MKQPRSEFKVGITVLTAILCLIVGILWGKQVSLTAGTYPVNVRFTDISGLEVGAPVLVNGISKGKVSGLELEQDGVIVEMELKTTVKLFSDARFEITSPELMGGKAINIFPGISGNIPSESQCFVGNSGTGMNALMRSSSELVDEVRHLLKTLDETIENINKTAGNPQIHEALMSSVENLNETTQRTKNLIELNEDKLSQIMENLSESSEAINMLVTNHAAGLDSAATDFEQFASTLNNTTKQFKEIADEIQSGQGTLGMLIRDAEFASLLQQTVTDLDSLVNQIRAEGIQTNISLFGKKKR